MTVDNDSTAAMAELSQAIAGDILTIPELSDPDWDTFALAAEVADGYVAITAYRYADGGPPVSSTEPEDDDPYWDLREAMRGLDGRTWDVAVVKIHRETANLAISFLSGPDADRWRVTPENMGHLPESLRPRAEDFEGA